MTMVFLLIITIVSYLIGSINTAILVGRAAHGDDIRAHGSGNAGATNALRTYGKAAAALVTAGDCLKAVLACLLAIVLSLALPIDEEYRSIALYCAGTGVVLGHNFPVYFGFKGGKGVLVSITVLMFADWKIALAILFISVLIIAVTKYVSLGSMIGAILFVVFALIFRTENIPYIVFTSVLAVLVIYMHRTNITRLFNGTERRLTDKKKGV